jgi:hypothetical protein
VALYEHSKYYANDAILFLANEKYTDRQKELCICSMQKAALADYVVIVSHCQKLFDQGKMTESVLKWAIAPNFSNRHLIVRNFNDEKVKLLLQGIRNDDKTSMQLKELTDDILSGKLWSNIRDASAN